MVGGNTDWKLTEFGKEQAHNIGKKLKQLLYGKIYKIYSSDLIRAKQTAEIINEYLNYDLYFRSELREQNVGIAKGKTKEWYKNNCAPMRDNSISYRAFPDAETFEEVYNRIKIIVNEILYKTDKNIIIIGHGGSIEMFIYHWLNIPLENIEKLYIQGNSGGVSFLAEDINSNRILKVWNDGSYII